MASALAHFPYVAIVLVTIHKSAPGIINGFTQEKINFLMLEIALQLVTLVGHVVPNPKSFMIQEMSIVLTLSWIYKFCCLTTTRDQQPNQQILLFGVLGLVLGMYVVGLQPAIFVGLVIIIGLFATGHRVLNKLTSKSKLLLGALSGLTFFTLGIEGMFCSSLSNWMAIPWHLPFDILFWQVIGSMTNVLILAPQGSSWIKKSN
jgi:hypothetical protein